MRRLTLVFVALVSASRAAWPQGNPLGPEFRVNTYTTSYQRHPSVAADPSGNFVVVWDSEQDGSYSGVFGQRYSSSGAPVGPEFRINTFTAYAQAGPFAGTDSFGNFIVVWASSSGQDGSIDGVFGQRYVSSGAPVGPEFRVNTYTTNGQRFPSLAVGATGNFVVVWQSFSQDGSGQGIFGQRYAASGAPVGPEFRVNTYTTNSQNAASVATTPSGNFVVVWGSELQDGSNYGIFGQRYNSSGTPLGPEFRVNTYTTSGQWRPSVATDPAGNFVVVWHSNTQDGSNFGVFGQRYDSFGAPLGPEFRVSTFTTNTQYRPTVAADSLGNFVVVWASYTQDGSNSGVFGQRYDNGGTPQGPEFRVNTYTTNAQYGIRSVAADPLGNFVVVWASYAQDGSGYGVFGQRYSQIVPVELMHFRVE
jgi:hypothetical protein